jgi:hypothetical protein
MRIQIFKDGKTDWVKEDRLERFLACGWQLAQPAPKKTSRPKVVADVVVEATAEVVEAPVEEIISEAESKDDIYNANH